MVGPCSARGATRPLIVLRVSTTGGSPMIVGHKNSMSAHVPRPGRLLGPCGSVAKQLSISDGSNSRSSASYTASGRMRIRSRVTPNCALAYTANTRGGELRTRDSSKIHLKRLTITHDTRHALPISRTYARARASD